jgi:SagB-type dehydrogenase family enzyme
MEQKDVIQHNRTFMKSVFGKPGIESDQHKGIPQPTPFKMCGGRRVALSRDFKAAMKNSDYLSLLNTRVSRRAYADTPLSLNVLSFLLWSAQGVKTVKSNLTFRNVPSGGARHPFEVYLAVRNVEGLEKGLYHYLAETHELEFLHHVEDVDKQVLPVLNNQSFTQSAAVTCFFAASPYRTEWRYTASAAKLGLIDAGHAVENLYLSCEAAGLGMCAIASYDQILADAFFSLNGEEEFVVYAAAIGTL